MFENNTSQKITALAITFNEEENVKRYVESLSFADEIIFVDSLSNDNTVAIAKEMGVTVIQNEFKDFSSQRNFAISQAKNDWITFFDSQRTHPPSEIVRLVCSRVQVLLFFLFVVESCL